MIGTPLRFEEKANYKRWMGTYQIWKEALLVPEKKHSPEMNRGTWKIIKMNLWQGKIGTCRGKRSIYEILLEVFITGVSRSIYDKGRWLSFKKGHLSEGNRGSY